MKLCLPLLCIYLPGKRLFALRETFLFLLYIIRSLNHHMLYLIPDLYQLCCGCSLSMLCKSIKNNVSRTVFSRPSMFLEVSQPKHIPRSSILHTITVLHMFTSMFTLLLLLYFQAFLHFLIDEVNTICQYIPNVFYISRDSMLLSHPIYFLPRIKLWSSSHNCK